MATRVSQSRWPNTAGACRCQPPRGLGLQPIHGSLRFFSQFGRSPSDTLPFANALVTTPYQSIMIGLRHDLALWDPGTRAVGEPVAQGILLGLLIQWSRVRFPAKPVGGQ